MGKAIKIEIKKYITNEKVDIFKMVNEALKVLKKEVNKIKDPIISFVSLEEFEDKIIVKYKII
ncbi:MAG: hypothetical protein KKD44_26765 [Proteobacteria bacterium]|nr:hypothetical protein [Pseudomonadota bacterium]